MFPVFKAHIFNGYYYLFPDPSVLHLHELNNDLPSKSEALKFSFRNTTEIMALPRKKMTISGVSNVKTHYAMPFERVKQFWYYA